MPKKFNRKYKGYQPDAKAGPPTERICKPAQCNDSPTPTPPPAPSP